MKIPFLRLGVNLMGLLIKDPEKRWVFKKNILSPWAEHFPGYSYAVKPFHGRPENKIGRYVSIGEDVHMGMGEHPLNIVSTSNHIFGSNPKFKSTKFVQVDHDVWIGRCAIIKSGVHIHTGAVIGAGAVVTKDVPPYAVVAGVPARVIKYRFDPKTIDALLKSEWWKYPKDVLGKLPYEDVPAFLKELKKIKSPS